MENSDESCTGGDASEKPTVENLNSQPESEIGSNTESPPPSRTPFTNLNQHDADLALARTLQEQERAYMMLRMAGDGVHFGGSETESGSYVYEEDEVEDDQIEEGDADSYGGEDAFDAQERADLSDDLGGEIDPTAFESDEAYARALQDAEEREVALHLMSLAGINGWEAEDIEEEEHGNGSQEAWQEVDPDELSYEELLALGEVVGIESRGLSTDTIASLPSVNYKAQPTQDGNTDQCVICRLDYEDGETIVVLSCKHLYHSECISNWLQINKVCPVCSAEVSTSQNSQ